MSAVSEAIAVESAPIPAMLEFTSQAAAKVASRFGIPCQVSLEEFMACAVGGCAGCAVKVMTPEGPAMKRHVIISAGRQ